MATITRQDIEREFNTRGYVVAAVPRVPVKREIRYPREAIEVPPRPIVRPPRPPAADLAPRVVELPEFLKVLGRAPTILPAPREEVLPYEEIPAVAAMVRPPTPYPVEEIVRPPIPPAADLAPRVVELPEFLKPPSRAQMQVGPLFPRLPEEAPPYEELPAVLPAAEAAAVTFTKPLQLGLLIAGGILFLVMAQRGNRSEGGES